MKNLFFALGVSSLLLGSASASGAGPGRVDFADYVSPLNKKLPAQGQWHKSSNRNAKGQMQKALSVIDSYAQDQNYFGTLFLPDDTEWSYTIDYQYGTINGYNTITSADITIYDENMKVYKTLHTTVDLKENETGINKLEISPILTKKFFNVNESYEIMLYVHATTVDYAGSNYTKVFDLGTGEEIATIDGIQVAAINSAKDAWSENFNIIFQRDVMEYNDEGEFKYYLEFDVYKKAGWTGGCQLAHTFSTDYELVATAGGDAFPILVQKHNGDVYYAMPRYEKPYFDSILGTDVTPDNNFIIDLYNSEFNLIKTTTIPMEIEGDYVYSMPGMGEFYGFDDIDFTRFSDGTEPMYIVAVENYTPQAESSPLSFYVYDTDGNKVQTIAQDVTKFMWLQDVPGQEDQWCLLREDDQTNGRFEFLNVPSCKITTTIPGMYNGELMSDNLLREQDGDSYRYAISLAYADTDKDGNVYHRIGWFNSDGVLEEIKAINLGNDIALGEPLLYENVFSDYLFNTNDKREYAFFVKKLVDPTSGSSKTVEVFRVYDEDSEVLVDLGPIEDTNEVLASVYVQNYKTNPYLVLVYSYSGIKNGESSVYSLHAVSLPLEKFVGGQGTVEDPYLIATQGDFKAIKTNPRAYYKLVADIDFKDTYWEGTGAKLEGSIDGAGHTISNLNLTGNGIFASMSTKAQIKNLYIKNVKMNAVGTSGILAGNMMGADDKNVQLSNVHVENAKVSGTDATFGGLIGHAVLYSSLSDCSVTGANYVFGDGSIVGGLFGVIYTSTNINNALFDGKIEGEKVGGIVGMSNSNDEVVSNCHVTANLNGSYIAGGIIGESGRSAISNCFVEGNIHASSSAKAYAGGVAGYINSNDKKLAVYVAKNCIVSANVAAEAPEAIAHRIAGFTSGDQWLVDWDSNDPNVDWDNPDTYPYVKGDPEGYMLNNYALDMAVIDPETLDSENSAEGKSISADELTDEFLSANGWNLGSAPESPWMRSISPLALYFEEYSLDADVYEAKVPSDESFFITFNTNRSYADQINVVSSDASVNIVSSTVSDDNHSLIVEVIVADQGTAVLTATLGELSLEVSVEHNGLAAVEDVVAENSSINFVNDAVVADGAIKVYNVAGMLVAEGNDHVLVKSLPTGVYVAACGDDTLKFAK